MTPHRRRPFPAPAVAALVIAAGAAGMSPVPSAGTWAGAVRQTDTGSLICGTIDMSRVPARLDWVDLLRIDVEPARVVTLPARDGLFWAFGIPPGTYRFLRFGGKADEGEGDLVYLFPPEGVSWAESDPARPEPMPPDTDQRILVIREPGAFCLGARIITLIHSLQYRVVPTTRPTEQEILRRLADLITDPAQRAIVSRRLTEIGGESP